MNKQKRPNDGGFTLIEVLIGLMIFSVGILGIGLMQLSAIRGNSVAKQLTEATVFGSDQIEQILSWSYDDGRLKSTNNNVDTPTNSKADGDQADNDDFYHAYWQITDNKPVTDSKTIDVTVFWNRKGKLKSFSLSAVKAK
ncbi:prepilin-type N-terminal cleavage/methylation domain-containing protein [Desulfobacter latus]|uniref:Prepilin-type N-terminal cleavage/methylation domain-containing protein n=1 Tax=Desulfobacter latus TaxID=2292 RepID=A0A850SZH9_9BACT|nr:prepilin-type N-terminal cleavage/methylation domain-containing protein [Desulfobacter latus]